MHAREVHAYETHAHQMHAHEIYAHRSVAFSLGMKSAQEAFPLVAPAALAPSDRETLRATQACQDFPGPRWA
jgi:hypothetical protein